MIEVIDDDEYEWDDLASGYRIRELPGGYVVWLVNRIFTYALVVGPDGQQAFDKHWCYETASDAMIAALKWDGRHPETEPDGWIRDPYTGRRRPGGDPAREYIAP